MANRLAKGFFLLAVVFLLYIFWQNAKLSIIAAGSFLSSEAVTGEVVSGSSCPLSFSGSKDHSHCVKIEFITQKQQNEILLARGSGLIIGDAVEVIYNKNHPNFSRTTHYIDPLNLINTVSSAVLIGLFSYLVFRKKSLL